MLELPMWKIQDFSVFRFYVKSILEKVKVEKMPFCNFRGSKFLIWVNFSLHIIRNQNSKPLNMYLFKIAVFGPLKSLKLISRKIWDTRTYSMRTETQLQLLCEIKIDFTKYFWTWSSHVSMEVTKSQFLRIQFMADTIKGRVIFIKIYKHQSL